MNKKDLIIKTVQELVKSYSTKLTLRQIYYRLVAKMIIENNINQYKYLSRVLVIARKEGKINFDIMEDRTRKVEHWTNEYYISPKEKIEDQLEAIKTPPYFSFNRNIYQQKITLIGLEKEALEGIFKQSISTNSILLTCKGYNSLTQLKELVDLIKLHPDKEINAYFFSDYDPSGLDIERNFIDQMRDLGIEFASFKRVGLLKEQIDKYNLPYAPVKTKDSRAGNWQGKGVVELDALEPNVLQQLIKDCCNENWNFEVASRKKKLEKVMKRRMKKNYIRKLRKTIKEIEEELKNGSL